jgi:hypothetical protein
MNITVPAKLTTRIALPLAAASAIAVGAAAIAWADPSPSPSASSGTDQGTAEQKGKDRADKGERGLGRGSRLIRHALHGELTVRSRGSNETHLAVVQRGEITKVDTAGKTLTMKSEDGFTRTYAVNDDTRIRSKGAAEDFADLKAGERAMVFGKQTGSTYTAKVIRCVREPKEKPATKTG